MLFANTNFKSHSSDSLPYTVPNSDTIMYLMSGEASSGYIAWKSYASFDIPSYEITVYLREYADSASYAADSILYTEKLMKKWTQKENYFRATDDMMNFAVYIKVNALNADDEIEIEGDYYPACPGCQAVEVCRYMCNSEHYAYLLKVISPSVNTTQVIMDKTIAQDVSGDFLFRVVTLTEYLNIKYNHQPYLYGKIVIGPINIGGTIVYKIQKKMDQFGGNPHQTGYGNVNWFCQQGGISTGMFIFNNDLTVKNHPAHMPLLCTAPVGHTWIGNIDLEDPKNNFKKYRGITFSWKNFTPGWWLPTWADINTATEDDVLTMGENGEFVFDNMMEDLTSRDVNYNPDYDNSTDSTPDYYAVSNILNIALTRIDKDDTTYFFDASSIYLNDSIVKTNLVIPKGMYFMCITYVDSSTNYFYFNQIETDFEELEDVEKLKTTIYPVPVLHNAFNVRVEALDDVEFEYRLMDLNSNVIASQFVSMNKGDSDILEIDFPVASYPYNMLVNVFIFDDGSSKTVKIITY